MEVGVILTCKTERDKEKERMREREKERMRERESMKNGMEVGVI